MGFPDSYRQPRKPENLPTLDRTRDQLTLDGWSRVPLPANNPSCYNLLMFQLFTTYLENGDTIEKAQQIAAHESPKTTKLYDRTSDQITLDEVERIII